MMLVANISALAIRQFTGASTSSTPEPP